ncbi:MAG: hypothetical protein AB1490_13415 [Pseudomonadota bacterium]
MSRRLKSILVPAFVALACGSARATASFDCSIDDKNATVELHGNIGSGDGAALQLTQGTIKLKAVRGKFDAMEFSVEKGQLVQQWTYEKDLRIGFMTDEIKEVSAYLVIIAQQGKPKDDIAQYKGRYVLKVQSPKGSTEFKGTLRSCEAG